MAGGPDRARRVGRGAWLRAPPSASWGSSAARWSSRARFTRALRAWAGDGPRRAYAEEVAALLRCYRDGLEAAGLVDDELFAWQALDALRRGAPPGAPRLCSSTASTTSAARARRARDDRRPLRRRRAGVAPLRARRTAFKAGRRGAAGARARRLLGAARRPLRARLARGPPPSQRGLFEDEPGRLDPGGAISFHSAGGERAELELAGARVLELLRGGVARGTWRWSSASRGATRP